MKSLLLILGLALSTTAFAQDAGNDLRLMQQHATSTPGPARARQRTWNPLTLTYRLGLGFYQRVISEQLATNCAFELTCSRFSGAMVKEFGFAKGFFLTFDRISRCNKISAMETYPVRLNAQGRIKESPADFHFHR
jgi:putative component of membrane protein insertase Oxa1/YidC/SpoIIIJ protein YidD